MQTMFSQTCKVLRFRPYKDEFGTPGGGDASWTVVGEYACRLSRKSIRATQQDPDNRMAAVMMLYLPSTADIAAGDLVETGGATYKASPPYRPDGHHLEVQVEWEGAL
jgi:hypothetical protein